MLMILEWEKENICAAPVLRFGLSNHNVGHWNSLCLTPLLNIPLEIYPISEIKGANCIAFKITS